jgi:small-conductance mechanosensitive channel|tara:strand:+ start:49353 stop:50216 length:864 start_codon:yes stop_codon:yes gene_type:complete
MNIDFLAPLTEKLEAMTLGFIQALPVLGLGLIAILLTWAISKFAQKLMRKLLSRSYMRRSLVDFFVILLRTSVWIFGILMAITIIFPSMTPAKMLAGLGIGGIAVGFAFKDVFENFMAGAMIMLRKPMRIGDYIECEGLNGKVESITIRDTHIRKTDDQLVLVPNSFLFSNPVYIRTDKELRRFTVVCGVSYDTDLDEAADVIQKAVTAQDTVSKDKPIQVYACEFNSSSVDFTIRWWSESKPIDFHQSRDQVIRAVKRALDDAQIEIPFPYRTLTFKESLNVSSES